MERGNAIRLARCGGANLCEAASNLPHNDWLVVIWSPYISWWCGGVVYIQELLALKYIRIRSPLAKFKQGVEEKWRRATPSEQAIVVFGESRRQY